MSAAAAACVRGWRVGKRISPTRAGGSSELRGSLRQSAHSKGKKAQQRLNVQKNGRAAMCFTVLPHFVKRGRSERKATSMESGYASPDVEEGALLSFFYSCSGRHCRCDESHAVEPVRGNEVPQREREPRGRKTAEVGQAPPPSLPRTRRHQLSAELWVAAASSRASPAHKCTRTN